MATDEAAREFSDKTRQRGEDIMSMTLKEAKELSDYLKDVHGIEPAAGGAAVMVAPAESGGGAPAGDEKTEFDVVLEGFGDNKFNVIRVVRAATALNLKDAKELVDKAPVKVKEGLSKEEADKLKADLEEAGAKVSIK
jgi:large subunit ribosomal protein L7/L12